MAIRRIPLNLSCLLLATAAWSCAANQAQPAAEFDVASVKLSTATTPGSRFRVLHGTLAGTNVVMKLLLSDAYGAEGYRISGGPAWMNSDRFDIEAKSSPDASNQDMMAMLRKLLEDRFKLRVHRETRETSVYVLTVAKDGPKVQPLKEGSCTVADAQNQTPPAPGQKPICGAVKPGFTGKNQTLDVVGMEMATWVRTLGLMLGNTVVDKTGIQGKLDALQFEYTREDLTALPAGASDTGGLPISTALREQLGLNLGTGKAPMEFLIVDSIEKPSGN